VQVSRLGDVGKEPNKKMMGPKNCRLAKTWGAPMASVDYYE